jgi:phosphoenolpyruvate carboxykinase (ATP)
MHMTQLAIGDARVTIGGTIAENLGTAQLVEDAVRHGEGLLAKDGPLVVTTGQHTGRSAKDKFIVRDATTESTIWWGKTNVGMTPAHFAALKADFFAHLGGRERLYRQQLFGGSQTEHRVDVQVITEFAWHSLFVRTMLVRPTAAELAAHTSDYTIIDLPSFRADPARHGTLMQAR